MVAFGVLMIVVVPRIPLVLLQFGLTRETIPIAGTGSMYPTFPKGSGATDEERATEIVASPKMRVFPGGVKLYDYSFLQYQLKHGDVVEFDNQKTKEITEKKYGEESAFVKRVIALPGDTIELRDGYVLLNGNRLDEPYTAKPRSTYGGDVISDCHQLVIPPSSVFVLGDNRKASLDSRFELGLIQASDIRYVMPWEDQIPYESLWRDTKNDSTFAQSPTVDSEAFVKLVNAKRQEKKLANLKLNTSLINSSSRRGAVMIETNDFSTEATKSGLTLQKALSESGYRNIVYGEVFTRGYFEADELLDNFLEFPQTKQIIFSHEYQDIGLSAVNGQLNGCPVQIIVAHFGGYVPPNYKQTEIDSWATLIKNITDILPSWEGARGAENIDQGKLSRLIEILKTRRDNAQKIYDRMKSNQWLTDEEQSLSADDSKLGKEGETLMSELLKH